MMHPKWTASDALLVEVNEASDKGEWIMLRVPLANALLAAGRSDDRNLL